MNQEADTQRRLALAVVDHVGMPYVVKNPDPFMWDGKRAYLSRKIKAGTVCHEIAHWLLAPKWRCTKPDFGLGDGPDTRMSPMDWRLGGYPYQREKLVKWDTADREEEHVSALGLALEKALGFDWQKSADDQSWDPLDSEAYDDYGYIESEETPPTYPELAAAWQGEHYFKNGKPRCLRGFKLPEHTHG